MRNYKKSVYLILLLSAFNFLNAQNTVSLHVPKALEIDAGINVTVSQNDPVNLGGNPTAQFGMPPYQYNWTPVDGLNDPSSPNPIATPVDTTTYLLEVIDANGCIESSQVTLNIITIGINEISAQDDITIFPNPNTGTLGLKFHSTMGEVNISFFDFAGKFIEEKRIQTMKGSSHSFDINQYPAGQYLLSITGYDFAISRSIIKK